MSLVKDTLKCSMMHLSLSILETRVVFGGIPVMSMVSVEEHRSLGGIISSRLDHGSFVGLIYKLLVFS